MYIISDTLESLLISNQIYYKNASYKWDQIHW